MRQAVGRGVTRRATFLLAAATLLLLAPRRAESQEGGEARRRGGFGNSPTWWLSTSAGWQWSDQVGDPKTNSVWDFDSNWSARFSAEREVAPRTTLGLLFNYARIPLRIVSGGGSAGCSIPCLGDATLATYGLMARSGGGPGFQFAYEGFIGATRYSNFTIHPSSSSVPVSEFSGMTNTDFAWALSTGFGYALARDYELTAMFDYGTSVHEKSGDLFQRRTTRHYATRLGLRVGL
ncbi:MAG: hypothetical protein IT359_16435 [Gemmatimonadaceae bacterium]|nr:hypothetical protein [Gemmatimonadaceae bacterium]